MKARPDSSRRLRLETLETRTLLAADLSDPYGLVADFNLAIQAVSGAGDFQASFDTRFGDHRLVISGSANSTLTIDMDKLPSFVTSLQLSSFESVTVTGNDHVENLILANIGSVAAEALRVDGIVESKYVGALSLASVGGNLALLGAEMKLSVDSFGELSQTFSEVKTLTLTTSSPRIDITAIPNTPDQTLIFTNIDSAPALYARGYESIHIGLPPVDSGNSGGSGSTGTDNDHGNTDGPPGVPTDGTNGTPTEGTTGTPTTPGTGPVVIVTHPIDEQTRLYLEQLSRLLHSSQDGADVQALALLSRGPGEPILLPSELAARAADDLVPYFSPANKLDYDFASSLVTATGTIDSVAVNPSMADSVPKWFDGTVAASKYVNIGDMLPDGLSRGALPEVDVTWPVLPLNKDAASIEARKLETVDTFDPAVTGTAQALGTYIIERVIAEFSPGQQSLVLLVDPQPTRVPGSSKKSSTEASFGLGGLPVALTQV